MTDRLLDDWFRDGLAANPHGPALRAGADLLDYTELDLRARAWAAALTADGHRPRRVGLLAGKNADTYAAFLGILYAGAAVVPLGADVPAERNAAVADAAGIDALVTGEARAFAPGPGVRVLTRPAPPGAAAFRGPAGREPGDLAYILFTSGSTGRPKGVPITHRNVSAFLTAALPRYDVGPGDRCSQIYELTFDLAVLDLFLAWGTGACLCALTRLQALSPERCVRTHRLTFWHSTPSLIAAAGRSGLHPGGLSRLRYAVFCGEPLPVTVARTVRTAAPGAVLDNIYGPTELTIACTAYRWHIDDEPDWSTPTVPIGVPLDGMDFVLLGPDGRPADDTGELCMTGPQMFGGYLDPANDRGRFVELRGRRWYRTGDRCLLDGKAGLVHLGRDDSQVKIQGYRVELAEVEEALRRAVPGRDAAVCTVDTARGTELAAFLIGAPPDSADVQTRLAGLLPAYMLPRHLWVLPEAPLNRNGKTDRAALRAEAARRAGSGS